MNSSWLHTDEGTHDYSYSLLASDDKAASHLEKEAFITAPELDHFSLSIRILSLDLSSDPTASPLCPLTKHLRKMTLCVGVCYWLPPWLAFSVIYLLSDFTQALPSPSRLSRAHF